MKLYNKENGINKVYVSREDIIFLYEVYSNIPSFIDEKLNEKGDKEYLVFDKKDELEYFKKIFWIIDYKEYSKLSFEELNTCLDELSLRLSSSKDDLITKKELLYQYKSVKEFIDYRLGDYDYNLPLVPDSDSFVLETSSYNPKYYIAQSIDQNKLLLYRENYEKMSYSDNIPKPLLDSAWNMANMMRKDPPVSVGHTSRFLMFSYDFKFYILETKFHKHKKIHNGKSFTIKHDNY